MNRGTRYGGICLVVLSWGVRVMREVTGRAYFGTSCKMEKRMLQLKARDLPRDQEWWDMPGSTSLGCAGHEGGDR